MGKEEKMRRISCFLLMLTLLLTTVVVAWGAVPTDGEVTPSLVNVSRSKTATVLDKDYRSTVTLSLPSAEEKLASDVVFVLDKSTSAELEDKALALLADLKEEVRERGVMVKVGVVIFNQAANVAFQLTELTEGNYATIEAAIRETISNGSNTHAGLLAGKKMLDGDTAVEPHRKHLIFVSDGVTYQFCKEDDHTTPYTRSFDDSLNSDGLNQCGTLSELNVQYEGAETSIPKGSINDWMSDIARRMETDNDNEDWDYQYTGQAPTDDSKLLQNKENVSNVEKALHLTESTYKAMQESGYQCHAVLAREIRQWGTAFMNRLAGGRAVAFDSIQHKVLYAVDKGSAVEDTVGKSFDLVPGTFCLTVGGQELQYEQDGNVTYFGGDQNERNYRFKIEYNGAADSFTWEINEPVSNFAPVKLSYTVKLAGTPAAGTHGVMDLNGDGYVDDTTTHIDVSKALYTNESAILTPVATDGEQGEALEFPKPSVSYTAAAYYYSEPPAPVKRTVSPTTFDAGIAVYAEVAALSLAGAVKLCGRRGRRDA
jgi:von Willebrand factor type A domain.